MAAAFVDSGGHCNWSVGMYRRVGDLSTRSVWFGAASGLYVLPQRSIPLDENRIHGIDLSQGRGYVEAAVWLSPRPAITFSRPGGCSFWISVTLETIPHPPRSDCGCFGRRLLLPA